MVRTAAVLLSIALGPFAIAQKAAEYHVYSGSTHAHSAFTWSHGDMLAKNPQCVGVRVYGLKQGSDILFDWSEVNMKNACAAMFVMDGFQYHSSDMKLRPDWQQFQGSPATHFRMAKDAGFDFYAVTDHSQEAAFSPLGPDSPQWLLTKQQAEAATSKDFVAIAGFEYSENDGPGGTGHINVFNTDDVKNALARGMDLTAFYQWIATAKPNGKGPVVASFNHPNAHSYADFAGRTAAATDIITLLEVINSNWHIHEEAFVAALDAGWKVAPTSGLDNHGLGGIHTMKSRVYVLAAARTKPEILEAMKQRRTYATLKENLQCRYTVNGDIMGSTLKQPGTYRFDISVSDPDKDDPKAKITKLDLVTDGGRVVQTYVPDTPSASVNWKPVIQDAEAHYFFVRVWNAGGGDAPKPDPNKPVAWLAPVWTGKASAMRPMPRPEEIKSASTAE